MLKIAESYYHYAPLDPAATPLLAAILPDWIKLHFQLDPNDGWSSPLVLDRETAERVRMAWADVSPRNLSDARAACLRDLKFRCPASGTLDVFAATDRSIPPDSLSLAAPLVGGDVQQEANSNPMPIPPSESSPKPAPPVNQDPISNSLTPGSKPDANTDSIRFLGWELCLRNNDGLALNNAQRLVQNSQKAGTALATKAEARAA